MKAMELLQYMDMADPRFVEEASDRNLLLLRKRRRRTRMAAAACLVLVVLAGVILTKPALYAWETRNTVTSWQNTLFGNGKPSPSVYVSAEMPDKKRFSADTPFTLSVGMGQASDYAYTTLSISAYGFEITDKDGNTVTDRYVRTISDFNSGEYGILRKDGESSGRVTGCSYLEDFTFRFTGGEDFTGWGFIEFSLLSRDESSVMGDSVTVWYTVQNGVLKLTDKNPVRGDQNGGNSTVLHPEEETVSGTVTLSKKDISVQVSRESSVLTRGQFPGDNFKVEALHIPTQKAYPTDSFTAELVYAESLRTEDFSFTVKYPAMVIDPAVSEPSVMIPIIRVPEDAPIGSYDLVVTDEATGFTWTFENMAWVLPGLPQDPDTPAIDNTEYVFDAFATQPTLMQGEDFTDKIFITATRGGEDMTMFCSAELHYAGEADTVFRITVRVSALSSYIAPPYIPVNALVGSYDLVVTDDMYGTTHRFEDFIEITENPDAEAERFAFDFEMKPTTVSLSATQPYTLTAFVVNRGMPFTVTETSQEGFYPEAILTEWKVTGGVPDTIPLLAVTGPYTPPYELTVSTGQTGYMIYELMLDPDTPCGTYSLILSYGDCVQVFEDVVEVVP